MEHPPRRPESSLEALYGPEDQLVAHQADTGLLRIVQSHAVLPISAGPPAPWIRRITAYLIDVVLFAVPGGVSVWFSFPPLGRQALLDLLLLKRADFDEIGVTPERALSGSIPARSSLAVLIMSAWIIGWLLYRVIMARRGTSVGKGVMGLQVVAHSTSGCLSARAAVRRVWPASALGLLPVPGLGFVCYLAAVFDNDRRGWHDKAAGSQVVLLRTRAASSEE